MVELKVLNKVSYSSLIDLHGCGFYFKLGHIDGLPIFRDSMDTFFGKLLHKYMQLMLEDKLAQVEPCLNGFNLEWENICIEKKDLVTEKDDLESMKLVGQNAISNIREIFEKEFPYKKVVAIEQRLEEPFLEKYPQIFKGFIDIVFELEDGTFVIADIKTCSSAFMFKKFQDKFKEYQLTLYKHFYSKKFGIDPDKIETYFILVEKNPQSKKPIQFSHITSGKKKVENALEWVEKSLSIIKRGLYLKNRSHCHAFNRTCVFYETNHCPK